MTKQEFMDFHEALVNAEEAPLNSFEKEKYFEGCMPIEVMAKRGIKTMLYGPMKPVGLEYPEDYTGPRDGEFKTPYAVVQLRQDNAAGSLYNIVGFQTHLKWGEQKRVFQMIPGLEMLSLFAMVSCTAILIWIHQIFLSKPIVLRNSPYSSLLVRCTGVGRLC